MEGDGAVGRVGRGRHLLPAGLVGQREAELAGLEGLALEFLLGGDGRRAGRLVVVLEGRVARVGGDGGDLAVALVGHGDPNGDGVSGVGVAGLAIVDLADGVVEGLGALAGGGGAVSLGGVGLGREQALEALGQAGASRAAIRGGRGAGLGRGGHDFVRCGGGAIAGGGAGGRRCVGASRGGGGGAGGGTLGRGARGLVGRGHGGHGVTGRGARGARGRVGRGARRGGVGGPRVSEDALVVVEVELDALALVGRGLDYLVFGVEELEGELPVLDLPAVERLPRGDRDVAGGGVGVVEGRLGVLGRGGEGAVPVVGDRDLHRAGGGVVGVARFTVVALGDGVGVGAGRLVGETAEGHLAVRVVGRLGNKGAVRVRLPELEGEQACAEVGAGEALRHLERDVGDGGGGVFVDDLRSLRDLCPEGAVAVVGDRDRHVADVVVARPAVTGLGRLEDLVAVGAGLSEHDLAEGHRLRAGLAEGDGGREVLRLGRARQRDELEAEGLVGPCGAVGHDRLLEDRCRARVELAGGAVGVGKVGGGGALDHGGDKLAHSVVGHLDHDRLAARGLRVVGDARDLAGLGHGVGVGAGFGVGDAAERARAALAVDVFDAGRAGQGGAVGGGEREGVLARDVRGGEPVCEGERLGRGELQGGRLRLIGVSEGRCGGLVARDGPRGGRAARDGPRGVLARGREAGDLGLGHSVGAHGQAGQGQLLAVHEVELGCAVLEEQSGEHAVHSCVFELDLEVEDLARRGQPLVRLDRLPHGEATRL